MEIQDVLLEMLRKKQQEEHLTDQEIANAAGISQSYVNSLKNGKRKMEGLTLRVLMRLFPDVQSLLEKYFHCGRDGSIASARNDSIAEVNGTGTAKADHNSKATVNNPPADARFDAAQDAILEDPKICDACKTAAIRHIRAAARR